jgi:hypothetical protein
MHADMLSKSNFVMIIFVVHFKCLGFNTVGATHVCVWQIWHLKQILLNRVCDIF